MKKVIVTYTNGEQEVFQSIDEDTIKVDGNILEFSEYCSLNGKHHVNLDHVRSWVVKL